MGFQDLHEETKQNEKDMLGPRNFIPSLGTGKVKQNPLHHSFLLNLPHLLKTQKFQNPTYSRIYFLQKTNSLKPFLFWSFLTSYGFL